MPVDVVYEGLTIAKAAVSRPEGDHLFVELEAPLPVGTRLIIRDQVGEHPARVEHVREGVGPGVVVRLNAPEPRPTEPQDQDQDQEGEARKGQKKRKKRTTIMGH